MARWDELAAKSDEIKAKVEVQKEETQVDMEGIKTASAETEIGVQETVVKIQEVVMSQVPKMTEAGISMMNALLTGLQTGWGAVEAFVTQAMARIEALMLKATELKSSVDSASKEKKRSKAIGGFIDKTQDYLLHAGEYVLPQSPSSQLSKLLGAGSSPVDRLASSNVGGIGGHGSQGVRNLNDNRKLDMNVNNNVDVEELKRVIQNEFEKKAFNGGI